MSRPYSTTTLFTTVAGNVRPVHFIELGFPIPVRLCSFETVDWDGTTFLGSPFELRLGSSPSISVFNEGLALGAEVLNNGTAGRTVKVWEGYRNDGLAIAGAPVGFTEPVLTFSGEMSTATIGDKITIALKKAAPKRTPRQYVEPPVFNHTPKAGTRIEMPSGVIILE